MSAEKDSFTRFLKHFSKGTVLFNEGDEGEDLYIIRSGKVAIRKRGFDELNELVAREIGRKVVVLGACTGSDAHAVGIDAIMNMKGYAGDYGLSATPCWRR